METFEWDVFVSYAREDKAIADALVNELKSRGITVWHDDRLDLADPLRASIDKALLASRFGIAILSQTYFDKDWTQRELEAMFALEKNGRKFIIPVWHQLTQETVTGRTPLLANRLAANTADGIKKVSDKIIETIRPNLPIVPRQQAPIPIVLAGCGWWARERTVLPLIARHPGLCKVMAVCEIKNERTEFEKLVVPKFREAKIPVPDYYRNLPQAIQNCRRKLDGDAPPLAVVINTPNQLHESLALQAFGQGCHVYAERPINRRSEELLGLLSEAKDNSLLLYNGVQRRLEPPFKYLFHVVENQINFGQLESIRCMLASGRVVDGWRLDRTLSGGGIVIDEGYHLLDIAVWLLEAANPGIAFTAEDLEVYAEFGYKKDLEVETKAFGATTLPKDVKLYFDFSYDTPIKSVYEMIELRDLEGNRVRYVRDLPMRTSMPGRILHQLRNSNVVNDGYVDIDPDGGGFIFVSEGSPLRANNTGPLRQFLRRVSEFGNPAVNLSTVRREPSRNECDARFVLNTQELVTAIYQHDPLA